MTAFDYPDFTAQSGRLAVAATDLGSTLIAAGAEAGIPVSPDVMGNASVLMVTIDSFPGASPAGVQLQWNPTSPGNALSLPAQAALLQDPREILWFPAQHFGNGAEVFVNNGGSTAQNVGVSVLNYTNAVASALIPPACVYEQAGSAGAGLALDDLLCTQAFLYGEAKVSASSTDAFTVRRISTWVPTAAGVPVAAETSTVVHSELAAASVVFTCDLFAPGTRFTITNDGAGAASLTLSVRCSQVGW